VEAFVKIYRLAFLSLFIPTIASAHIGVVSGPAFATKSGKITFAINHGCKYTVGTTEHEMDTLSVKIDIPAGINGTSVRAMPSDFGGKAVVAKNGNAVTSITWTRDPDNLNAADDLGYYELTLKATADNVPFTKLAFTITQVCRLPGGAPADDVTVVWTGSAEPEPAPTVMVLPPRTTGWNKFTLTTAVAAADFKTYFADAQIVWKETAAFSTNPVVAMLITMTSGVTTLATDLAVGDVIWVKY
jgi:periplasmic copper chaperone A